MTATEHKINTRRTSQKRIAFCKRLWHALVTKIAYPIWRMLPLQKKKILFEDSWGASAGCNPQALQAYISQYYPSYECIWAVNNPTIETDSCTAKIKRGGVSYYYTLARCKYLVNNVNFPNQYIKRPGQIEVHTTHGTPLKGIGLDAHDELPTRKKVHEYIRRCERWDYLVVQGKEMERISQSCFVYRNTFLRTGFPRNDYFFDHGNPEDQIKAKQHLGLSPDCTFVLYAPTWRTRNEFTCALDFEKLLSHLSNTHEFGLRQHWLTFAASGDLYEHKNVLNVSGGKSLEELLVAADVLITDYSSIMFDYALLKRPILFYAYDLALYRSQIRRFNLDYNSDLPGPILSCTDEVLDALINLDAIIDTFSDQYATFCNRYLTYEQGTARKQICECLFGSAESVTTRSWGINEQRTVS